MRDDKTNRMLAFIAVGLFGFVTAQLFAAAQAQPPQTSVRTDNGLIVFMVDGQEKARLDATGLHVNGDMNYSGTITDTVTYQPPADGQKAGAE